MPNTMNPQVSDSITTDAAAVIGTAESTSQAMADQVMAFAVGLAMQNAVAQQQQAYVLKNAITTAAARAILDSKPEEALRFAREMLATDDVATTLERLKKIMDDIHKPKPPEKKPDDGSQP